MNGVNGYGGESVFEGRKIESRFQTTKWLAPFPLNCKSHNNGSVLCTSVVCHYTQLCDIISNGRCKTNKTKRNCTLWKWSEGGGGEKLFKIQKIEQKIIKLFKLFWFFFFVFFIHVINFMRMPHNETGERFLPFKKRVRLWQVWELANMLFERQRQKKKKKSK